MLLNCGVGEDSWESLGLQGDPTSPYKGDQSWVFIGRTEVEAETPVIWLPDPKSWLIWKDPDAGKDWGAGGEGNDRGRDGWMASPTQWTWVWVGSRSCWWTGRPVCCSSWGCKQSDMTEQLNWTEKHSIQKSKIMAYGQITSWQIYGETMERVADYFLRFQNHCRWCLQSWN